MAQEVGIREQINARFSSVEARLSSVEARLSRVETAIDDLRKEVHGAIDDLRKEVHTNFRWIIGIVIVLWGSGLAMWGSILGVLVALR